MIIEKRKIPTLERTNEKIKERKIAIKKKEIQREKKKKLKKEKNHFMDFTKQQKRLKMHGKQF